MAAERIRAGGAAENGSGDGTRDGFVALADALRNGRSVPPLILVSADGGDTRIVLEGHVRLTAFALAPDTVPEPCEALLGMSPAIANWDEY